MLKELLIVNCQEERMSQIQITQISLTLCSTRVTCLIKQRAYIIKLQITLDRQGLLAFFKAILEFKIILTNWRHGLRKYVRFQEEEVSARCCS